ncbi:hypothetical protein [Neoaquamicrobium sediminum]|uniref:hypothetical protein n=1 Tax=Neoaquamicrobium sediminum TaxID=1849104 RepID=UPI001FD368A3|nr:hypothetical protein [Mesorhizobium sediminum]
MRRTCSEICADRYMLVEPSVERGPKSVRIITSNWIFDALEDLGTEGIAAVIESGNATGPGMQPRAIVTAEATFLSSEERRALRDHGHAELYCQKLDAGGTRIFALFSGRPDMASMRQRWRVPTWPAATRSTNSSRPRAVAPPATRCPSASANASLGCLRERRPTRSR